MHAEQNLHVLASALFHGNPADKAFKRNRKKLLALPDTKYLRVIELVAKLFGDELNLRRELPVQMSCSTRSNNGFHTHALEPKSIFLSNFFDKR